MSKAGDEENVSTGTWVSKRAGAAEALHIRKCRLEVVSGPDAGRRRVVESPVVVIGRESADLVLSDRKVSAMHAEIRLEDAGYRLRDLGSTNGTWIQSVRVYDVAIPPGAVFTCGDSSVRFVPLAESVELALWRDPQFCGLVGKSVVMRELFERIDRVAATESTVLISGETGTGKELVAEAIHERSPRSRGAFCVMDCGAIPAQLFEDQLFGHVEGAFTGATRTTTGLFEAASGGTLFLDEIGELPLDIQPKLLRTLESHGIRRIGSHDLIECNVRLIAATNRDLATEVNRGAFRSDLYYRVGVVRLHVPPLRDHLEDLEVLVEHFLATMPVRPAASLPPEFFDWARKHTWPGNVRELRNAVERAVALRESGDAEGRGGAQWPLDVDLAVPFKDAKQQLMDAFDRRYMTKLLDSNGWNISAAARTANVDRMSIYKLLSRLGIRPPNQR